MKIGVGVQLFVQTSFSDRGFELSDRKYTRICLEKSIFPNVISREPQRERTATLDENERTKTTRIAFSRSCLSSRTARVEI